MSNPGFQWYVAWRYLLARPRKSSSAIVGFALICLWVCGGFVAAQQMTAYSVSFLSPGPVVPEWILTAIGFAVAAGPTFLLTAVVSAASRRRFPGGYVRLAAWFGAVATAMFGTVTVLRMAELPFAIGNLAVLTICALAPVRLLVRGRARARGGTAELVLGGIAALIVLFAAGSAVVFELLPHTPLAELGVLLGTAVAIGTATVTGGRAIAGPPQRSRRLGAPEPDPFGTQLATVAVAMIAVGLAIALNIQFAARAAAELASFSDQSILKVPMVFVISPAIAGTLFGLSLLLLAIRYFFTFFTTVSMGGVAIGSMALVTVLSVMSGFENDLRKKILGSNAHMLVSRADEAPFVDYREVMEKLEGTPGVVGQSPYLLSEVVIAANNNYANVVIKGVVPETVGDVTELGKNLNDPDGLKKLWPLSREGEVLGAPKLEEEQEPTPESPGEQGGGGVDPAPEDFDIPLDDEPVDFSGDLSSDRPQEKEQALPFLGGLDPGQEDSGGDIEPSPEEPDGAELEGPPDLPDDTPDDLEFDEPDEGEADAGVGDDEQWLDDEAEPYISPRVAQLPGVLAGRELVKQINLFPGQEVKIVSPLGQDTPVGPVPRTRPIRVAGSFFTGMYEYDLKFIYVELGVLQDFLDLGDEVEGVEIRVEDPDRTDVVAQAIATRLGDNYRIQDWKELNRSLFSALKLEKIAMFLILAVIILVASFSIVGNLIMVVVEKSREISILKTLGASDIGVLKIFVVQGFFIGLVGTSVGVSLGLTICWLGTKLGLPLDPDVYYIDRLPIHVEPTAVAAIGAAGLLISVIATLYPAYIAARMQVVKGLRWE